MTKIALDNLEELVKESQCGDTLADRAIALGGAAMLARFLKESGEMDADSYNRMCRLLEATETGIRRDVA